VTPLSILAAQLQASASLADGMDAYIEEHTTPPSAALRELAAHTRTHRWEPPLEQEMLSGHVEGQLLRMLVRATGARRVLEIGMFTGYSALAIAEALTGDGVVVACEIDAEVARFAREHFAASPAAARIDVRVGPAAESLADLEGPFDLVFIDADKPGYPDYLAKLLPLVRPGGLILAHNMRRPAPDPRYIEAITTNPDLETSFVLMDGAGIGVTLKKR